MCRLLTYVCIASAFARSDRLPFHTKIFLAAPLSKMKHSSDKSIAMEKGFSSATTDTCMDPLASDTWESNHFKFRSTLAFRTKLISVPKITIKISRHSCINGCMQLVCCGKARQADDFFVVASLHFTSNRGRRSVNFSEFVDPCLTTS